jgi:hypothetical protein
VKELVKNVHYFQPFFFTEKASEKLKALSCGAGHAMPNTILFQPTVHQWTPNKLSERRLCTHQKI